MTKAFIPADHPRAQVQRDSETLLAAVIAFSRDAIISTSPEGVIQTWNDGAQRLLGWSAQEAVGLPFLSRSLPISPILPVMNC